MSTDLSPDRAALVDNLVAAGNFSSRREALDRAVDLLQEEAETLEAVREGLASIERGEGIPVEESERRLREKYKIPKDA